MENKEIVDLLKNYFNSDLTINSEKKKIILNLYTYYIKLNKLKNKIPEDKFEDKLLEYENKIYNIKSSILTDIEKIELEINNYRGVNDKKIALRLQRILNLIKKKIESETLNPDDISKIKKLLIEIQILSNNNITFYKESYDLFELYLLKIKKELEKKEKVKK